ncbi:binding-protein-dependent transporter inner membrane component [Gracilibacillus halophilus YIM-C55.5]|uniref:Binding-protein-dependent transporter inner membrane component n=1 Tax=Gracilibacillus halophilus YIM-C55.5 TaxID=1308866 RepID=N4WU22_9BACI|nr:binding-protein-dependent transporter inner membrane component [Gracilibacillus halophilus YIM-C55.5]
MAVQAEKKEKRKWITPKTAPYFFLFPAVLLFLAFMVYPIIASLILSFQTRVEGVYQFSGLDNYIRLFSDPIFYKALGNTFIILFVQVPIMLFIALLLAVFLNVKFLRARAFYRVSFFTPAVTSLVAASIIFILLLNTDYGLVNFILASIGLEKVEWLTNSFWARVSLILVTTWRWAGYNMVILLAGLQNIPNDLYEAASIDGASQIRKFFHITIPQLKPVLLFTFVLSTIGTFQLFDEPYNLTNGGPNNATLTITYYLYNQGFNYFDFGYASAIAILSYYLSLFYHGYNLRW